MPSWERYGLQSWIEAAKRRLHHNVFAIASSPVSYRLRKQLPEPVFGQIKQARGFRQFLMRGFDQVRAEWAIVCTAHNLLKLAHRWTPSASCPMVATVA